MSIAGVEVNVVNVSPLKPPLGEANGNAINDTLTVKSFHFSVPLQFFMIKNSSTPAGDCCVIITFTEI